MNSEDAANGIYRFLTNHAAILATIARDPELTVRRIADQVGITERRAAQIVQDLRRGGYITTERVGRRSRYTVHPQKSVPDRIANGLTAGGLLQVLSAH